MCRYECGGVVKCGGGSMHDSAACYIAHVELVWPARPNFLSLDLQYESTHAQYGNVYIPLACMCTDNRHTDTVSCSNVNFKTCSHVWYAWRDSRPH